jgi:Rod binding domain-containing protein
MAAATMTPVAGQLPGLGVNELMQPRMPAVRGTANPADARRVGEEFEAMFLSQMLAPMFDQIRTDGPFGGGNAETMYRSFLVDAYAKSMVKAGGIGIADNVQREILKLQETSHG